MTNDIIKLKNAPKIIYSAAAVGQHEHDGTLGRYFDWHCDDDKFGMDTWEKAEGEMQRIALNLAMAKGKLSQDDIGVLFAGDLINQCTCSAQGLLSFDIPYFGLYGACSTAAEGMALASMLIDGGHYERAAVVTSSHNCSSERQYRFPLEYGGQRTPTSQWTVTGAGAFILSREGDGPCISEVLVGRTVDRGITDANNMGAAMAPAALDTLLRYFRQSGTSPSDFDMIITGDLGYEGSSVLTELALREGYDISGVLFDCGLLIYDRKAQDMHAGGSGCGCFASVMGSYIIPRMRSGNPSRILAMATGALMSPLSVGQGQSIPGIAHLLRIESGKK